MSMAGEDERNGISLNTPLLLDHLEDVEANSGDQLIHASCPATTSFFTTCFNGLNALSAYLTPKPVPGRDIYVSPIKPGRATELLMPVKWGAQERELKLPEMMLVIESFKWLKMAFFGEQASAAAGDGRWSSLAALRVDVGRLEGRRWPGRWRDHIWSLSQE
ncbi:hypothetical protein PanWU01x14_116990 [Parasponia andersonii]|uniref:Uncharacterized protein n=1 Tax=Parasponia andersonii TaxID=3476 RepID=A0A2P5CWM4_PARAD|nr:hypothetical protein PanWU01x14_116990 [Parasponia andersonii]